MEGATTAGDTTRPRWSVVIPVYDCAGYLARMLPKLLAQLPADAQITVVDDRSRDDPESVVAELGAGRVEFVRNPRRLGAVANFNRCLALARGELVHLLHGDDGVAPGFYAAMESALADTTFVAAVCRTTYVDEHDRGLKVTRSERDGDGPWHRALDTLAVSNRIASPSIVVRRDTYRQVGDFHEDLRHAADWEMWSRLAAAGPIWYIDRPLALYRVHGASDTSARVRTGANVRERITAVMAIGELLERQRRLRARQAFAYSALFAVRTAKRCWRSGEPDAAWIQLRAAGWCALLATTGRLRPFPAVRVVERVPSGRHDAVPTLDGAEPGEVDDHERGRARQPFGGEVNGVGAVEHLPPAKRSRPDRGLAGASAEMHHEPREVLGRET